MDKIKNICEKNKYTMCIFIGMLIFTTVICTNFIKTHFALDTYCVYLYDSQELISHFLLSNRIVSALARWIFDVLRIPLLVNMKILSIIGILFLATAWFILYKFIIRISNKQNNIFYNILIIGISFIITSVLGYRSDFLILSITTSIRPFISISDLLISL